MFRLIKKTTEEARDSAGRISGGSLVERCSSIEDRIVRVRVHAEVLSNQEGSKKRLTTLSVFSVPEDREQRRQDWNLNHS